MRRSSALSAAAISGLLGATNPRVNGAAFRSKATSLTRSLASSFDKHRLQRGQRLGAIIARLAGGRADQNHDVARSIGRDPVRRVSRRRLECQREDVASIGLGKSIEPGRLTAQHWGLCGHGQRHAQHGCQWQQNPTQEKRIL